MTRRACLLAALTLAIAAPAGAIVVEHLISDDNQTSLEHPHLYFDLITGETSYSALGTEHYFISNVGLGGSTVYARQNYATVGVIFLEPSYRAEAVGEGVNVNTLEFLEPPIGNPMGAAALVHVPGQGDWEPLPRRAFLGLRFLDEGNVHYAWAELTVHEDESLTIHRLAYETEPETGLVTPPLTTSTETRSWGETKVRY